MNKKAKLDLFEGWPIIMFIVFLIFGFILTIITTKIYLDYIIIIFAGFFTGGFLYYKKYKKKFPFIVIIIGFLIGYIIGSFGANWKILLILYVVSAIFGHYLHDKEFIKRNLN